MDVYHPAAAESREFRYLHIQRAACSVRPDPGLTHLEEWGWTESWPWPAPCEALEKKNSVITVKLSYMLPPTGHRQIKTINYKKKIIAYDNTI